MLRRATLLLTLLLAMPAAAQDSWPSRPITILGGFPNGSGVDIYARKLAEPLARALGQPVVVDNRSGAGGNAASLPSIGSTCCLSLAACTTSVATTNRQPAATTACAL